MKLAKVEAALEMRNALISELKTAVSTIYGRDGAHPTLDMDDMARKLADELDWDVITKVLE